MNIEHQILAFQLGSIVLCLVAIGALVWFATKVVGG